MLFFPVHNCPVCGGHIDQAFIYHDSPSGRLSFIWGDVKTRRVTCKAGAWLHFIDGGCHRLAFMVHKSLRPAAHP